MPSTIDIMEKGAQRLLNMPEIQQSPLIQSVIQGAITNLREQEAQGVQEEQILNEMLPQLDQILEGLEGLQNLSTQDATARDTAVTQLKRFKMASTSKMGQQEELVGAQ